MMGVSMGTPYRETLPAVYPQIINSVPFCKEYYTTPIIVINRMEPPLHSMSTIPKRYRR